MRVVVITLSLCLLAWGLLPAAKRGRAHPQSRGARPPATGPPGARLVFEPASHDIPPRAMGEPRRLSLPWVCRGRGALRVLGVRGDCACAAIGSLPSRIRAGARGVLVVDLAPSTRAGPQRVVVRAYTSGAPPHDEARVVVRGWIGSPGRVAPARLDLGPVTAGATLLRTVDLILSETPDALEVVFEGVAGAASPLPVRGPPAARLASDQGGRVRRAVRVGVHAPSTTGPFAGALVLRVPGQGRWRVPISGCVVDRVSMRRPAEVEDAEGRDGMRR